jgi:hypothetical protein
MPLVTAAEVRAAMGEPDTTECDMFIAVADVMVSEQLASASLTLLTKKNICLYLAAHLTLLSKENGPLAKKMIMDVTEGYHDVYGPGLMSTRFGQIAVMLDTSGTFAALSQQAAKPRLPALFTVVGSNSTGE